MRMKAWTNEAGVGWGQPLGLGLRVEVTELDALQWSI